MVMATTLILFSNLWIVTVFVPISCFPKGAQFVGVGYNILKANPDGDLASYGGVDPGLLYTRRIFELSGGTAPRELVYEERYSCTEIQKTTIFYGTKSYQDKLGVGIKASGGPNALLASFSFTLSPAYNSTKEKTNVERQVFQDHERVCNLGRARYADELAEVDQFSVSRGFASAVCHLPKTYNQSVYMDFLNAWGTHVTMEVEMGTKTVNRSKASLTEFMEHMLKNAKADVSVGGSYLGFSASIGVNFDKFKSSQSYETKFGTYQYTLVSGSPSVPEPIGIRVVTMDETLSPKYWQKISEFVQDGACHLQNSTGKALLTVLKNNILRALSEYPAFMRAPASSDPPLLLPVTWPKGTYGLMMTQTGCPSGYFHWHQGMRLQDTRTILNKNTFSTPLHLYGMFSQEHVQTFFCIKGQNKISDYDLGWDKGDYCILKYGNCPSGFREGFVKWDDQDPLIGRNLNTVAGVLPDGVYDANTKIMYCCRNDSLPTEPIILPTDRPFYLLRYTRTCQKVVGLSVSDEFVEIGDKFFMSDDNTASVHPFDDGTRTTIKLHYCYYSDTSSPVIVG